MSLIPEEDVDKSWAKIMETKDRFMLVVPSQPVVVEPVVVVVVEPVVAAPTTILRPLCGHGSRGPRRSRGTRFAGRGRGRAVVVDPVIDPVLDPSSEPIERSDCLNIEKFVSYFIRTYFEGRCFLFPFWNHFLTIGPC